jgi:branched-chain amino acid transport system substrate-binding protein
VSRLTLHTRTPRGTGMPPARRARLSPSPWLVVAAAVVLAATACSPSAPTTTTDVAIGVLDPLSGSNASQGTDSLHGAELAADVINQGLPGVTLPLAGRRLPNLGGAKLAIVSSDDAGVADKAATETTQLVNDRHVAALSGAYQSAVTLAVAQKAERLGIPFVNGDSSSTSLTNQGLQWFFRVGPTDQRFGEDFFSLLKEEAAKGEHVSTIGIVHTNDQYGNDGATVTSQLASQNGQSVAVNVAFDAAATDLTSQVQALRAAKPDVLFVLAYTAGAQLLLNAFQQLDYTPPALLAYGAGFSDPTFIKSAGAALAGYCRRVAWSADLANRNPTAKAVADAFQKKFNAPLTENSARAFTAIITLAQAINAARSTDPGKIRSALTALDVRGADTIMPWDGIRFDQRHQNIDARGVVEQYLDGAWRAVSPHEIASRPVVWPASSARTGS